MSVWCFRRKTIPIHSPGLIRLRRCRNIRANEEDFLTFKAKLLLKDAAGDPIKKAALINDMVQSIVQIPDPIQRSVYIKECARIMDIDENLLIAEVGRSVWLPRATVKPRSSCGVRAPVFVPSRLRAP